LSDPDTGRRLVGCTQNLMMPAYYLMVVAVIASLRAYDEGDGEPPIKGATPAASDIQERKKSCASITIILNRKSKISTRKLLNYRRSAHASSISTHGLTSNR
jgi:hypothetical protein